MIIEEKDNDKIIDSTIQVGRFDIAINFYCCIKNEFGPQLVCYDYNPEWKSWYPFYDDKNKTPVICKSNAINYGELKIQCDKLMKINLSKAIEMAKQRFRELVADVDFDVVKLKNFITYEIKFSKSTGIFTIYKLYNFIINKIDNVNQVTKPKELKCKLFNLNEKKFKGLISNAKYIIEKENINDYML